MNSLFEMIDNYIREHGIPFKSIYISKTYFPEQFNKIIEIEARKLNPRDSLDNDYCLTYDENGCLLLVATAYNTRIVLADNTKNIRTNFRFTPMNFENVFEKSCFYKYNLAEYNKFKKIIKDNNPSISDEMLEKTLSELIDVLNEKLSSELNKTGEDIFHRDPSLLGDFIHAYSLIIGYIDYLNSEYKNSLLPDVLTYNPPNPEGDSKKKGLIFGSKTNIKKNAVISVDERIKILNSYNVLYKCFAKRNDSKDADMICYLYGFENGEYTIVLEPYSGEERTKIIRIHKDNDFSYEEFQQICIEYLERSNSDNLSSSNIALLNHTTKDTFGNSIGYALTGNKKIQLASYTKANIDTLSSIDISDYSLGK